MKYLSAAFCSLVIAFLSACGGSGGSGGSGNSISLNQDEIELLRSPYDDSVTSATVQATFKGDGVVVGFPPGEVEAAWLVVDVQAEGSTTASFRLSIYPSIILQPGTHSTVLRFATGNADGAGVRYVDLPITVAVDEEFRLSTPQKPLSYWSGYDSFKDLEFWAIGNKQENVMPKEAVEFSIHGRRTQWSISSSASWVTMSAQSGTGDTQITLGVNLSGLDYGMHNAELTVTDSYSGTNHVLPVSFDYKPQDQGVQVQNSTAWQFEFDSQYQEMSAKYIVDSLNQKIYVSDSEKRRLYVVNSVTGITEKYFSFDRIPWNMALTSDGGRLYLALLDRDHSAYYWAEEQRGSVAIIDTATYAVVDEFRMYMAPGDLMVTDTNRLIVGVESSQHVPIASFDAVTGVFEDVIISSTSPVRRMELLPDHESFIYRSGWRSPPPVFKASVEPNSSDYTQFINDHGDWEGTIEFWLSPDATHLLTSYGDLYAVADLRFIKRITLPYVYLTAAAMDAENNRLLMLDTDNRLIEFDLTTFEEVAVRAENFEPTKVLLYLNGEFRAWRQSSSGSTLELVSW